MTMRVTHPFALLICLSLPAASGAMKRPPGWSEIEPPARANGSTARIERPEQAAAVLGEPVAKRNLGRPIPLDRHTLTELRDVHTEPGDLPQLQVEVEGKKLDLPLEHTHVKAEITGYVARVEVTQTYQNPFAYPIEAIYVFPLPENSAVDDMRMVIGERVIEAEIKKRDEARRTYEQAKRDGHTAALLEQERPNVFTQSVANIEPGTNIDVVVRYLQDLTYDAGEYELVFPMVVGPRFFPGDPKGGKPSGSGYAQDTNEVPDASRVSPPVLGGGMRSGHDISLELVAKAGLPISTWEAPTHDVEEVPTFDGSLALRLSEKDSLPNRDFVLRYRVDGEEPQATLLQHHGDHGGFLTLIVQPPKLDIDALVGDREIVFVVDVSGSMSGVPLSMCKDAMQQAIRSLRPADTFNVITFAGRTGHAFNAPRPANQTNILEAMQFVDGMRAGGGTYMLDGIQAALSTEVERGRHRYVFFLTDGYVGNEDRILASTRDMVKALAGKGQRAKVFGFGVGSSVNRYLLDGLGKAGQGVTVYATTREDPTVAVNTFYRYIDHSILRDVEIDWGGLDVKEVFPTELPDLFASRPLIVHARYGAAGSGSVRVRGKLDGKAVELPVAASLGDEAGVSPALATLWARAKIGWLERDLWSGPAVQAVDAITKLGLEFRIVTRFTSFVAVDRSRKVGDGSPQTVVQPVETPEGVDPAMAGAGIYGGVAAASSTRAPLPLHRAPRQETRQAPAAEALMDSDERETKGGRSSRSRAGGRVEARKPAPAADAPQPAPTGLAGVDVQRLIAARIAELSRCTAARGGAKGKLVLRWFITAEGVVIQLKVVESTLKDADLERCILTRIKTWRFPTHSGGPLEVVYPLVWD